MEAVAPSFASRPNMNTIKARVVLLFYFDTFYIMIRS